MGRVVHISDTAFLIAGLRASENDRAQPLFRDPLAHKLAGDFGKKAPSSKGLKTLAWSVAIRTVIIDDLIEQALAKGVDTILNLGAGLDTRPYRMELPPSLRWIEVDFPAVIDFKNERLADDRPNCRVERFKFDLTERASRRDLFAEISKAANKILVITECVIPYLAEADVAELADDLRRISQVEFWIIESRPHNSKSALGDQHGFLFDPANWFDFFADHGWRPEEIRQMSIEARRLGRPSPEGPSNVLWRRLNGRFVSTSRREQKNGVAYVLLSPGAC
jgi:methyltransferase (TIGR00027 family)